MPEVAQHGKEHAAERTIQLPAPTAWPIVLALGCTMAAAGLVTNMGISILGGVLMLAGCIGWFRQVLPHEQHEEVAHSRSAALPSPRRVRWSSAFDLSAEHRAHLPIETYPVISGIKGGIAGGIAMIFPALLYGLIAQHSIWYPVNLLGGAGVAHWRNPTTAEIAAFHWQGLLVAIVIHTVTCVLVGLLYGAMLPMLPRHPVLLGGILAPVLWTGLLHSSWASSIRRSMRTSRGDGFVVSQVTSGVVAGLWWSRAGASSDGPSLPWAARLGIEAPGMLMGRRRNPRTRTVQSIATRRSIDALGRDASWPAAGAFDWLRSRRPGKGGIRYRPRPEQSLDFATLYGPNCAALPWSERAERPCDGFGQS